MGHQVFHFGLVWERVPFKNEKQFPVVMDSLYNPEENEDQFFSKRLRTYFQ